MVINQVLEHLEGLQEGAVAAGAGKSTDGSDIDKAIVSQQERKQEWPRRGLFPQAQF